MLVSTWVLFQDGKFYQDPVLYGEDWFICFDDEDPPELVVRVERKKQRKSVFIERAAEIMKQLGVQARPVSYRGGCMRLFPPSRKNFADAVGMELKIKDGQAMPVIDNLISGGTVGAVPGEYGLAPDGVSQCTFYNFRLDTVESLHAGKDI